MESVTTGAATDGLTLIANGNYVLAKRHRDMVFTSGMTPRREGRLIHTGTFTNDQRAEDSKDAVELAVSNAIAAARRLLRDGEMISSVLTMTVFVSATDDFNQHSRVADHASNWLCRELGPDGIGTRAAVGVASLPGGALVEIQLTAIVADTS
ncbi:MULTISPECIES: RidA family protein [unclassified Rhizobium]|uniref:RidA family protein n=1 Tax=unclassified Rhizobium TaxID=2613769 RepID=UPI000EA9DD26|nr:MULTISPECIES: RidA family protein [unclassified Rhizobium]AYG70861.1 RidA family protein [Rhizobium sp. CCGE531]AYG77176.1 RidA family protein [Rhizobium sp. CCGE532]